MKPLFSIITAILFLSFAACSSNEIGYSKDVNPETVYMDYYIRYTEGENSVNCLLQYRFAGENGTTLVLSSPSKVSIDGKEIKADSSEFSGAYYEKKFSAATFTGDHTIAFTDVNNKKRKEVFNFHRTRITNDILSANKQTDLVLKFENINERDIIEVNISDTSGVTENIVIKAKPVAGKLTISAAQLQSLSSGPCSLDIYKSVVQPLQQPIAEGGKLVIDYIIKKAEIELREISAAPTTL
ncbi:hypothetical protein BH10BAC2_BH10BAC2_49870 [soil metagenome]